jgi:hypothetical protein
MLLSNTSRALCSAAALDSLLRVLLLLLALLLVLLVLLVLLLVLLLVPSRPEALLICCSSPRLLHIELPPCNSWGSRLGRTKRP